ncbi:switch-associated protein 70 isoform X1 [Dendroctonus ponderosae]|uniref:switch-associated protein 70 isoform X1 n=1 Tax=Dendroctonus ponderosae TaxID=77166 RepID=UPI00203550B3|nr:switch-associated protein 70 isoform X1 [Dendroctonus ponderosae]XP_048519719.1 switch-associated protein 70 isoform X1 [Dendroctonus ponderosae]
MSILLENVTNCVCLAFKALQQDQTGLVNKSKLKVLTANIGTLLDLYGVEKGLEHFRSTLSLSFDQYRFYLQNEVFSSLPAKLPLAELREYESRIAEVCWLVCRKRYLQRDHKVFTDDTVFQLYRIFCVLAELVPDNQTEHSYQVLIHPSEICSIAQTVTSSLGCIFDEDDFTSLSISMGNVRLTPFIAVIESRCLTGIKDSKAIKEAIIDVYQKIVEDVIKKGYLTKRGYIFPSMREFWFVLRPSELSYYKNRSEKDKSGALPIEVGSRVEATTGYRIILHTPERNFELGAPDHMTRLQWISALQLAADHSGGHQTYGRLQVAKRRIQRQGRVQEMLQAKTQLQQERTARQAAEGQAKELEALVKEDSKKLGELGEIKVKLEKLLEEETQAKRDEEIVRALQARVLAEEWEKRDELERLQCEQKMLLDEERIKRQEYEARQREKEEQLRNAEQRLAQLEKERHALDDELKQAREKIVLSEGKKDFLEAKLYQYAPVLREGDRVRRAHSFMPSTKERPVLLEVRSATLRRSTKK